MAGSKHGRWGAAAWAVTVIVSGCVGLGEPPSSGVEADRLRAQPQRPAEPSAAPNMRIPADAVAQAPQQIPLVPVPPPPLAPAVPAPGAGPAVATSGPLVGSGGQASRLPPRQTPPHTVRQLLQMAAARYAGLDSYIVRLTRREQLKDRNQPEELLLFKFRKEPFSVHFKWLDGAGRGREVVYVKGRYENKIHTLLAAGDAPLMPAGARFAVAPDSLLARRASRHSITEAGIGYCLEVLTAILDAQERGDRRLGTLTALPPQNRPEYPRPLEAIERLIPPGAEPELPRGGRRILYFDPDWQLPLLVVTYDDKGQQVEYYRHDRMQAPVHLDDDDFNPDKLWAKPGAAPAGPRRR